MIRAAAISAVALVVVALAAAAGAAAAPITVEVRVDTAAGATVFDGPIATEPHGVDGGDGTGSHPCSGGAGSPPVATATGALDDAMRAAGIPWRGNWDPSFRDFFVDRIGPYSSAPPDDYWSLTVDGRFAPGGCLARLAAGDVVHFTYGSTTGAPSPAPGAEAPAASDPTPPPPATGPGSAVVDARAGPLARRAAAFLRRHPGGAGAGWGRLALAVRRGREVGAAAASLLGSRLGHLNANGSLGGDVNATVVAVLALGEAAPRRAAGAARWLVSVQDPEGGFGFRPRLAPDVDTTALAAWALARAARTSRTVDESNRLEAAAARAASFVLASQGTGGGFPSAPGGAPNSQSTGLALVALRVTSDPAGPVLAGVRYLAALQHGDGSVAYAAETFQTPVWTTAQALLGLTPRGALLR